MDASDVDVQNWLHQKPSHATLEERLRCLKKNVAHWRGNFWPVRQHIQWQMKTFCLRPSTKDQGITWVVLVVLAVLHHLVHYLIKRNLSEKKSPWLGIELGSFKSTAKKLSTELQSHRYYCCESWFLYLTADLEPVLVDTCFCWFPSLEPIRLNQM